MAGSAAKVFTPAIFGEVRCMVEDDAFFEGNLAFEQLGFMAAPSKTGLIGDFRPGF